MNKEIILKYLNNQCSPAELEEVVHWAMTDPNNLSHKKQIEDLWLDFGDDKELDDETFYQLFDKIMLKINSVEPKKLGGKSTVSLMVTWTTRVAAILLLPVLLLLFYTLSEKVQLSNKFASISVDSLEVEAPFGSRAVFQLSDGTLVHLNYGSKLKYPIVFPGETREVNLVGEGYFEVAHDPEKPFVVNTGNLKIKALGTVFNVFAYTQEKYIEATLVRGKVNLEEAISNKTIVEMIPGQHIRYDKSNGSTLSTMGKVDKYISWKDGKLIFEDTPITEVVDRLGKMFNVDIQVNDNIRDYNYTVTIIDEPLFQILDLMTMAAPVKYTVLPRVKNSDGTFSRQKITLEKRK